MILGFSASGSLFYTLFVDTTNRRGNIPAFWKKKNEREILFFLLFAPRGRQNYFLTPVLLSKKDPFQEKENAAAGRSDVSINWRRSCRNGGRD
jgi:hypothetical protein